MDKKASDKDVKRISLMSDKRSMPALQKALAIKREVRCTQKQLTSVCKVSNGALYRAEKAKKAGRDISRRGRPPLLNREEELILIEMIKDKCLKGMPPTSPDLAEMALGIKKDKNPDLTQEPTFTDNWVRSFRKRHAKSLACKKPNQMEGDPSRRTTGDVKE